MKEWIAWETHKEKIIKAVEESADFPNELFGFLSTALGVSSRWFDQASWILLVNAFHQCLSKSPEIDLPITSPVPHEKSKEEAWEYPTRTWHLYSHLLAKAYGWTLSEISQLHVEEALAKIQEIIVDDQLEKEFYHGLSETAYVYNKNTKQSKFVPLSRPYWMQPKVQPEKIKKFQIPVAMMPVGNIVMDGVLPPELMPKEPIH